jgi:predicted kinase
MNKPYAVIFSGVPGSSKSIIAYYLSGEFGLPIFNSDNIRFEVREDMLLEDINISEALQEYERRSRMRRRSILSHGKPFILDGSMDRRWAEAKDELREFGYDWFLINMELSRGFLLNLYNCTGRHKAAKELDAYLKQHEDFMARFGGEISVQVTDDTFSKRCEIAAEALKKWLYERGRKSVIN